MIHITHADLAHHLTIAGSETIFAGIGGVVVYGGDHQQQIKSLYEQAVEHDGYAVDELCDTETGGCSTLRMIVHENSATLVIGTERAVSVELPVVELCVALKRA